MTETNILQSHTGSLRCGVQIFHCQRIVSVDKRTGFAGFHELSWLSTEDVLVCHSQLAQTLEREFGSGFVKCRCGPVQFWYGVIQVLQNIIFSEAKS